ncbi:hypothetical protein Tco_0707062, partial [Tanacetum coccineum]
KVHAKAVSNWNVTWTNPKGHKGPVDICQPFPLQEKEGRLTIPVSNHDIFLTMAILSVFTVKVEKKFGMLLLLNQHKLFNLDGDDIIDFRVALRISVKELYMLKFDPKGVIYEDKQNHKRLMRDDELYMFSDGTLTSVRKTLHYRLMNFWIGYNDDMPKRKWTKKDQFRSNIMVNMIDKQLLERRIMRSLEVLVGGSKTETDRRLLQRTV